MTRLTTCALALAAAMFWVAPASAQTISYAEAIDVFAKACGGDIQKLCSKVPLNKGELFTCLRSKESSLSANCRTTAAATVASLDKRAAAQDAFPQICGADIKRLCREYDPGNGRYLRCLEQRTNQVSAPCNQAITDAGWR